MSLAFTKGMIHVVFGISFLLTVIVAGRAYGQAEPIHIITNPSILSVQFSDQQLRRIFSMRQSSWPDGQRIQVFVLPSHSPIHLSFCKQALRMFPYQIERMWNKFAYSGLGVKPLVVADQQEMLEKVAQTSGSIGYVGQVSIPHGIKLIKVLKE